MAIINSKGQLFASNEPCKKGFSLAIRGHGLQALDVSVDENTRYWFEILLLRFRSRIDHHEKFRIRGCPVQFGFVEAPGVARSGINPEAIWLSSVFVIATWNFFHGLCSIRRTPFEFSVADSEKRIQAFYRVGHLVDPPETEFRKNLAFWLWRSLCEWAFMHEFSHIRNGHIDLATQRREQSRPLSALENATLEMDADAFATQDFMNTTFGDPWVRDNRDSIYECFSIPLYLRKERSAELFLQYFSLSSFLFLRGSSWDSTALDSLTHPPLAVRDAQTSPLAWSLADRFGYEAHGGLEIVALAQTQAIRHVCDLLNQMIPEYEEAMRPHSVDVRHYNQALRETWASLRGDLNLLKRSSANLAPI